MSTETASTTHEDRGFLDRLLASPFLSDLLSNRLAILGLSLILLITLMGVLTRLAVFVGVLDFGTILDTQFAQPRKHPPCGSPTITGWLGSLGSCQHPFGTDAQRRDVFLRTMYGAWLALKYGTVTVAASTVLGVGLGTLAVYYGGWLDNVVMRTMDVLLSFPSLLLALAVVAIFGTGLWKAVIALTLVYTPRFARVVRGAALKVLEDEYVDATVALGARDWRVIVRHVLPNSLAPITVQSTLNFGLAVIDLAALSFLGFGATAGTPSWGWMLTKGVNNGLLNGLWWMSFFPGLFLALTVLGFNLLGDGMRDALDPRMQDAVD
ncbi:ABC transporter permease [Haloarchaeobius baliensis]|uniref:ABC transporter permease n=1 Tax=Haloarchaeobius baliensis TaxID=1670458 RepID=UPI003F883F9D